MKLVSGAYAKKDNNHVIPGTNFKKLDVEAGILEILMGMCFD